MFPHIETSQLICCANQGTGFYMRATLAFNGLVKVSNQLPNVAMPTNFYFEIISPKIFTELKILRKLLNCIYLKKVIYSSSILMAVWNYINFICLYNRNIKIILTTKHCLKIVIFRFVQNALYMHVMFITIKALWQLMHLSTLI